MVTAEAGEDEQCLLPLLTPCTDYPAEADLAQGVGAFSDAANCIVDRQEEEEGTANPGVGCEYEGIQECRLCFFDFETWRDGNPNAPMAQDAAERYPDCPCCVETSLNVTFSPVLHDFCETERTTSSPTTAIMVGEEVTVPTPAPSLMETSPTPAPTVDLAVTPGPISSEGKGGDTDSDSDIVGGTSRGHTETSDISQTVTFVILAVAIVAVALCCCVCVAWHKVRRRGRKRRRQRRMGDYLKSVWSAPPSPGEDLDRGRGFWVIEDGDTLAGQLVSGTVLTLATAFQVPLAKDALRRYMVGVFQNHAAFLFLERSHELIHSPPCSLRSLQATKQEIAEVFLQPGGAYELTTLPSHVRRRALNSATGACHVALCIVPSVLEGTGTPAECSCFQGATLALQKSVLDSAWEGFLASQELKDIMNVTDTPFTTVATAEAQKAIVLSDERELELIYRGVETGCRSWYQRIFSTSPKTRAGRASVINRARTGSGGSRSRLESWSETKAFL